ncbi:MAG: hypothetical protein CVU56_08140 [Deltaproteobacteria bacterium HGW-Deltaproteobacteria-14]|nr:MAG: hypothetical protein CVU56_08140 [Deltaproteobacteria bacterium HGW-Deltaproteobacteria-14]
MLERPPPGAGDWRPALRPDATRSLLALLLVAIPLAGPGCGTSCEEIARHRQAFLERTERTDAPHATLTIPLALANQLVAERLAGRPGTPNQDPAEGASGSASTPRERGVAAAERPARSTPGPDQRAAKRALTERASDRLEVELLDEIGLHLGVVFTLDAVRLVPADADRVGVEVDVSVRDGRVPLFALGFTAEVRLVVDPRARTARVLLRPDQLRRVSPRLDAEGRARVTAWIRGALPDALGRALDDRALGVLADEAVAWLGEAGFPLVRDNLLDGLDEEPLIEVALPDLPLESVTVTTVGGRTPALRLGLVTPLPVTHGLGPDHRLPARGVVELRLAGETAAELANAAIARGDLPSRYTSDGEADPAGPFEARVGWGRAPRPLKVHLWRTGGECTYARVGGTPVVTVTDDEVRVAVSDGVYEVIKGPALTEAFAWTKALFGDSVRLGVAVARRVRVDAAGVALELGVAGVAVGATELRVTLQVRSVPGGPEAPMVGATTPRRGGALNRQVVSHEVTLTP